MKEEIAGKRIVLQKLKKNHIPNYLSMLDTNIQHLLHISSKDAERDYLMQRIEKQKEGKTFFYTIMYPKDDALIGALEVRDVQEHPGQLYTWINSDYWGKGYFQEAMALFVDEYFNTTKNESITAHIDLENKRSYHALKKVGFIDTGIFDGPFGKQYKLLLRKK